MRRASLKITTRLIREYKKGLPIRLFANLTLVFTMKGYQRCSLLVIYLSCLIQGRIDNPKDKRKFVQYEALNWMSNSRNASGTEWWKVGTYFPKMYSWQPHNQARGELYTKKPRTLVKQPVRTKKPRKQSRKQPVRTAAAEVAAPRRQQALTARDPRIKANKKYATPIIPHRKPEPYHPFQDAGCHDLAEVNTTDLARDSACKFAEKRASRERRQVAPDALTELGLSEEQFRDLKARVNRRFLVGYDCSKPMEVKPISSFIHDPCIPNESSDEDTYDIEPETQFQIVQYETRREFSGSRCERYISQFTYYCGNADHASPLPQETFFRRPKVMANNECRGLQMGQYRAKDGKTYSIAKNTRREISYFALGTANAYDGWDGNQVTCSGGRLLVDGVLVDNMVMYVTEEILFRDEKFILREDDDGVIAHFNNVRLTCPIEDEHCVGGDVTYVWRVPIKSHCPLYHVRRFKGQIVKYDSSGLTIKSHKVAMSTDSSHVRFVIKGSKVECDQKFLVTNYPDLLIRDTMIDGIPDRDLVDRELPKDELKLSNFITNRDDFVYHEITRNLRREFASILHDECKENLRKTKTEHFLDREMPNFHTYRLGGSNYLTAAGEVAYFYKCRPRLVAAIQAQTCYDALPVEVAQNNYTLTSFTQEDGEEVVAPRYYIEPLTHRITSVAKKVPCLSQFFARYKDIFGQWFAVTPQLSITEPPGTLDLESLKRKVLFDPSNDIDLSKGGVYDPDAVDDLITWLEGNRRQEVVVHQLADQVGNLNPGQYITPKLMFPSYTLPGGSWHSFILGKIWGAIRGLGEIFSTIFGLFIVGRIIWYLFKVLMNCGYIHRAHGCSPQLAWSFCTEVLFTHHYQKVQRRRKAASGRTDTDPTESPTKKRRTMGENIRRVLSCGCIDDLKTSDSDEPSSPAGQASRQEMSEMLDRHVRRQEERLAKQEERLASTRRVQSNIEALNRDVTAFKRFDKSPPPYVTPPSSNIAQSEMPPSMPRLLPIRKPEFEGSNYVSDSVGRTSGRTVYPQAPLAESPVPQPGYTLDGPP